MSASFGFGRCEIANRKDTRAFALTPANSQTAELPSSVRLLTRSVSPLNVTSNDVTCGLSPPSNDTPTLTGNAGHRSGTSRTTPSCVVSKVTTVGAGGEPAAGTAAQAFASLMEWRNG